MLPLYQNRNTMTWNVLESQSSPLSPSHCWLPGVTGRPALLCRGKPAFTPRVCVCFRVCVRWPARNRAPPLVLWSRPGQCADWLRSTLKEQLTWPNTEYDRQSMRGRAPTQFCVCVCRCKNTKKERNARYWAKQWEFKDKSVGFSRQVVKDHTGMENPGEWLPSPAPHWWLFIAPTQTMSEQIW